MDSCARHGTISPTLRAGVPFLGALRGGGGGGWRLLCAPSLVGGGGSPVGALSGLADKTRWRPLGTWAPSRKNLGFAGGDSAIWYGWTPIERQHTATLEPRKHPITRVSCSPKYIWYGMVWYGMVWYGMVWYGMVWYGMVWYGMLLLLLLLGHPARAGGRNCQTRSPWAGRKGAVGRRHAGRACADDD